jgi:hypothetical protein
MSDHTPINLAIIKTGGVVYYSSTPVLGKGCYDGMIREHFMCLLTSFSSYTSFSMGGETVRPIERDKQVLVRRRRVVLSQF